MLFFADGLGNSGLGELIVLGLWLLVFLVFALGAGLLRLLMGAVGVPAPVRTPAAVVGSLMLTGAAYYSLYFTPLPAVRSLVIAPAQPRLAAGTEMQLELKLTYTDGTSRDCASDSIWTSSNSNVTVNGGHVKAAQPCVSTLTATLLSDDRVATTANVTVTDARLKRLEVTPATASGSRGLKRFSAVAMFSDGSPGLGRLASLHQRALVRHGGPGAGRRCRGRGRARPCRGLLEGLLYPWCKKGRAM